MPLPLFLIAALAGAGVAGAAGIAGGIAGAIADAKKENDDSAENENTKTTDSNSKAGTNNTSLPKNNTTIPGTQLNSTKREPKTAYKVGQIVKLCPNIKNVYTNIESEHLDWVWKVIKVSLIESTQYLDLEAYIWNEGCTYFTDTKLCKNLLGINSKYVQLHSIKSTEVHNMSQERKSNSQYRFTALGLSGSGKTCFMAGMYYKLARGFEGYTLKADDDDDVRLTGMYERMKNASAGQDRFPVGTNQTADYSFELQYGYETISQFDWIDYDGNALKLKNSGNAKAYQDLKDDIAASEILYVFVDGGLFDDEELEDVKTEKDKIEILADIVADSCAAQINHFISEYTKEKQKLPPIAIVVTKYDIVHSVLGKANRAETMKMLQTIIKEAFTPLFPDPNVYRGAGGHTSMVGIIPVSLGSTINENGYTGRLRPINMHLPVYMGIWFMLKKATDFIQSKNLTDQKYTDLLKKQTASMARLADVLEENEVYFSLNGQTGKFSQLAEGYFEAMKEKC